MGQIYEQDKKNKNFLKCILETDERLVAFLCKGWKRWTYASG